MTAAATTHCQVRPQEVVAGLGSGRPAMPTSAPALRAPVRAPEPAPASRRAALGRAARLERARRRRCLLLSVGLTVSSSGSCIGRPAPGHDP